MRGATELHGIGQVDAVISIHAPRAGSDRCLRNGAQRCAGFQSTLPVRGATRRLVCTASGQRDFNPRSPCGERRPTRAEVSAIQRISIHAPRAGSDVTCSPRPMILSYFNPRSPCGERRLCFRSSPIPCFDFNPRSPCGERPDILFSGFDDRENFNPRSPCGERPSLWVGISDPAEISIHAPRAGSDGP